MDRHARDAAALGLAADLLRRGRPWRRARKAWKRGSSGLPVSPSSSGRRKRGIAETRVRGSPPSERTYSMELGRNSAAVRNPRGPRTRDHGARIGAGSEPLVDAVKASSRRRGRRRTADSPWRARGGAASRAGPPCGRSMGRSGTRAGGEGDAVERREEMENAGPSARNNPTARSPARRGPCMPPCREADFICHLQAAGPQSNGRGISRETEGLSRWQTDLHMATAGPGGLPTQWDAAA